MNILIASMSLIVTNSVNIAIAIIYKVMYTFSIGIFIFVPGKFKGQVNVMHIAIENISQLMGDRYGKHHFGIITRVTPLRQRPFESR